MQVDAARTSGPTETAQPPTGARPDTEWGADDADLPQGPSMTVHCRNRKCRRPIVKGSELACAEEMSANFARFDFCSIACFQAAFQTGI